MILTHFLKLGSSRAGDDISTVLKYIEKNLDRFILFLALYWTESKAVDLKQYSLDLYKTYNGTLLGLESVIKRYLDSIEKDSSEAMVDLPTQANAHIPYNFDFTTIIHVKPEWERTFATLLSHFDKLIFDGDSGEHIELTKTSPELVVKEAMCMYNQVKIFEKSAY